MDLTILTTTYNRKNEIKKLYNSLTNQTNKDFRWLIIDDGSEDNTEYLINQYINENKINIEYHKKNNEGKHIAINYAMQYINTTLTFIVDSDDWLTDNAVEDIYKYHEKYKNRIDLKLCGYSFLRGYSNGKINGEKFKRDESIGNFVEVRLNDKITGDKAEVWYTKCLKEYPFPKYKNEKFLGEDIVWINMAAKYNMVYINKVVYVGNYLNTGLTNNRRKNNINSPNGCIARANAFLNSKCKLFIKIKPVLQYDVYSRFAKKKIINKKNSHKAITILFLPLAELIYILWKIKYKRNNYENSNDRA